MRTDKQIIQMLSRARNLLSHPQSWDQENRNSREKLSIEIDNFLLELDMLSHAKRAVEDNLRHSRDSLYELLSDNYPEASDESIDKIINQVL